jgi:hypothetical protein
MASPLFTGLSAALHILPLLKRKAGPRCAGYDFLQRDWCGTINTMGRRRKRLNLFPPSNADFPLRHQIQATLVQIMKGRGGEIEPQIAYEEVADRLNISAELRKKLTPGGRNENAWRAHVGWARDDLVKQEIIAAVVESGRGLWRLTGKEFHNPDDIVPDDGPLDSNI